MARDAAEVMMSLTTESDSGRFRLESGIWRLVSRDAFTRPGASCTIVRALAEWVEKTGRRLEDFLEGIPEGMVNLSDPQAQIEWDSLVRLYTNLGKAYTEAELIEGGRHALCNVTNASYAMVLRQLSSVREMYFQIRSAEAAWVTVAFPGLRMEMTDLGPGLLLYQLKARPGYVFPREFALCEQGLLEVVPTVWGLPMARVRMRWIRDGAQYVIEYPQELPPLIRLRRFFYRLIYRPKMVMEYRDTIARLQTNYRNLSAALEQRERLSAERDRLAAAIGAADESVVITDRNGVIEYVNSHFTRQTGYTAREALGNRPSLIKSGFHGPDYYEEMWQILQKGEPWRGALVNRRKDGGFYEVELSISPVRDRTGTVTHYVSVERDVTERNKLNSLLQGSFPAHVLEELRTTGNVKPRRHEHVAVLFADIVDFTDYSANHPPDVVLEQLQRLVEALDPLVEEFGCVKVKTIGDAYLATVGLFDAAPHEPVHLSVQAGAAMINAVDGLGNGWQMRVGIDYGPLISGVIGRRQRFFDIWGDTVNTAARLQAIGRPCTVNLSERAWQSVAGQFPAAESRRVSLKGKGSITLYEIALDSNYGRG